MDPYERVLCPAVGSPGQDRHEHTSVSAVYSHKGDEGTGEPDMWEANRAGTVQPGGETLAICILI